MEPSTKYNEMTNRKQCRQIIGVLIIIITIPILLSWRQIINQAKGACAVTGHPSREPSVIETPHSFPRKLHYIWPNKNFSFGGHDPNGIEQRETWGRVNQILVSNPGWEMTIWTDEECDALMKEHFPNYYDFWNSLKPKLKMWDAVRPAILYVHGGIYLDHDTICTGQLKFDDWIKQNTTTLLLRAPSPARKRKPNKKAIGNHFMGSTVHHQFWNVYLENIVKDQPMNYSVDRHTGPQQLYPTFFQYIEPFSSENLSSSIRILELTELDSRGECELFAKDKRLCDDPRCSHLRSVSPAELDGEDDNPQKQIKEFKERMARVSG